MLEEKNLQMTEFLWLIFMTAIKIVLKQNVLLKQPQMDDQKLSKLGWIQRRVQQQLSYSAI